MYFKNRKKPIDFTVVQPPKVYRDPTMKRNKSDTNLELIGQEKNTSDISIQDNITLV
jgi:hypothetical protein